MNQPTDREETAMDQTDAPEAQPSPIIVRDGIKRVADLQVGDVVTPPQREVSLWMRRVAAEKGLPDSVLAIAIERISEGAADKRGRWICVSGYLPDAWYSSGSRFSFTFKARPETPWPVLRTTAGR
jgi:hypothetical protein